MLELGVKILASYLLGSLNGSLILGRLYGIDVRQSGSGNPGGTNALRTGGARFALQVMLIDVGKGFLPPWLFPLLILPGVPLDPEVSPRGWRWSARALRLSATVIPSGSVSPEARVLPRPLGALAAIAPVC